MVPFYVSSKLLWNLLESSFIVILLEFSLSLTKTWATSFRLWLVITVRPCFIPGTKRIIVVLLTDVSINLAVHHFGQLRRELVFSTLPSYITFPLSAPLNQKLIIYHYSVFLSFIQSIVNLNNESSYYMYSLISEILFKI